MTAVRDNFIYTNLGHIEPIVGNVVFHEKNLNIVEFEDGVNESGCECGGGIGERRKVQSPQTNSKHCQRLLFSILKRKFSLPNRMTKLWPSE